MELSVGARKLGLIAEERGHGAINQMAAEVGCNQSLMSRWISGDRTPGREWSKELFRVFGIDRDLWDETLPVAGESGSLPTDETKESA